MKPIELMRVLGLLVILLFSAQAARAQEKVTLKPNLVAQQTWDMSFSWHTKTEMPFEVQGIAVGNQEMTLTVNGVVTYEQVKDGLPVKARMEFGKDCKSDFIMAGKKTSRSLEQAGKTVTATRDAEGELDITPENALGPDVGLVMQRTMDLGAEFCSPGPVGVGNRWEMKKEAIAKTVGPMDDIQGKIEVTLVKFSEVQGRKCAEVAQKGQIKGIRSRDRRPVTIDLTATATLDLATGVALTSEARSILTEASPAQPGAKPTESVTTAKQTMAPKKTAPER